MEQPQDSRAAVAVARALGMGAIVAAGAALAAWALAAVMLIAPLSFWFAWNVLEVGPSMGLPELGFWATLLATAFLMVGWLGKVFITAIVFIVDPGWLDHSAVVQWPEPTLRNFLAIALLAALAGLPRGKRRHTPQRRWTS